MWTLLWPSNYMDDSMAILYTCLDALVAIYVKERLLWLSMSSVRLYGAVGKIGLRGNVSKTKLIERTLNESATNELETMKDW